MVVQAILLSKINGNLSLKIRNRGRKCCDSTSPLSKDPVGCEGQIGAIDSTAKGNQRGLIATDEGKQLFFFLNNCHVLDHLITDTYPSLSPVLE